MEFSKMENYRGRLNLVQSKSALTVLGLGDILLVFNAQ
jgi:hypothetical protein